MTKIIFKTIGVVAGSSIIFGSLVGFLTYIWGVTTGDVFAGLGAVVIGIVIGYPIGAVVGIILVRKVLRYKGSLIFGILGFILGGFLSGVIIFVIGPVRLIDALISGWATSPVYAMIAFFLIVVVVPLSFALGYSFIKQDD
ncbi:MAG: hypothetical protein JSU79_06380 [Dehalococcoidales bacterium]|nr:MAG: hypothetical protein JSU79_06380 [Dehalococcoidales bacterium]